MAQGRRRCDRAGSSPGPEEKRSGGGWKENKIRVYVASREKKWRANITHPRKKRKRKIRKKRMLSGPHTHRLERRVKSLWFVGCLLIGLLVIRLWPSVCSADYDLDKSNGLSPESLSISFAIKKLKISTPTSRSFFTPLLSFCLS